MYKFIIAVVITFSVSSCVAQKVKLVPVTMLASNRYRTDGKIDSGATSATTYFYSQAFQIRGFKSVVKGKLHYYSEDKQPLDSALIIWANFPYNYHESPEYKKLKGQ